MYPCHGICNALEFGLKCYSLAVVYSLNINSSLLSIRWVFSEYLLKEWKAVILRWGCTSESVVELFWKIGYSVVATSQISRNGAWIWMCMYIFNILFWKISEIDKSSNSKMKPLYAQPSWNGHQHFADFISSIFPTFLLLQYYLNFFSLDRKFQTYVKLE